MRRIRGATIKDLSLALNISRQAVNRRAIDEGWKGVKERTRGAARNVFFIDLLPFDVRNKYAEWLIESGPVPPAIAAGSSSSSPGVSRAVPGADIVSNSPHYWSAIDASQRQGPSLASQAPYFEEAPGGQHDNGRVLQANGGRFPAHATVQATHATPLAEYRNQASQTNVRPVAQIATAKATLSLTDRQREVLAARAGLVAELQRVAHQVGMNRAIAQLVALAGAGELPEALQALVPVANAKAGESRTLSRSTLMRWMREAKNGGAGTLAPKTTGRDYTLTEDVAAVLSLFRQPNKPSLAWCATKVAAQLGIDRDSLYHRANRYRKKIPQQVFHVGRHTGAVLKALQPFRRRDFQSLAPNDVWVGDGHGAKLKVAHPVTGSPFVPEVTAILDVATRYCVGWSVALSENCLAVADALRHSVSRHGVPLIYYSDNGGGQKNQMFDAPITGTLGRLGIQHETGRPGNPQGRGVIERFWQTTLIPLAREFETYQGKNADRETLRRVSIDIDRSLRAVKKGEVTALPRRLPTWQQFIDALDDAITQYNEQHRHRSLPKLNGSHHATPAEYRQARIAETGTAPMIPDRTELATMFMPAIRRRANRGEVRLFNGLYFHTDLMLVDGEDVQVCYDVHDVSRVWVKKLSGEFIAEAVLDGNRDGFMPKPLIDRLAEERAKRRMGRLQAQVAEVQAELEDRTLDARPVLEPLVIEAEPENVVALPVQPLRSRPLFDTDAEKFTWLMEHTDAITSEDESWIAWYRSTSEWEDLFGGTLTGEEVATR